MGVGVVGRRWIRERRRVGIAIRIVSGMWGMDGWLIWMV